MSGTINFINTSPVFDERYFVFNTDTKVERVMFPLNKTLVFKINKDEYRYNYPIYSIWTMEKVSEEINKKLMEYENIESVDVKLI